MSESLISWDSIRDQVLANPEVRNEYEALKNEFEGNKHVMTKQFLIDGLTEPLSSDDPRFNFVLRIVFEDESKMEFQGAFYTLSRVESVLQVFTEHCGYYGVPLSSIESIHIFPCGEEENTVEISGLCDRDPQGRIEQIINLTEETYSKFIEEDRVRKEQIKKLMNTKAPWD